MEGDSVHRRAQKKESFNLTTPLEHIDFHITGYSTASIWSLWHISLEETLCHHIGYFFRKAARDLLHALSHRQDSTIILWWTSYGPLVGMENSPNCKCTRCAGSTGWSKPSEVGALPTELRHTPTEGTHSHDRHQGAGCACRGDAGEACMSIGTHQSTHLHVYAH